MLHALDRARGKARCQVGETIHRRLHPLPLTHQRARVGSARTGTFRTRSTEKAPAPRIMRKATTAMHSHNCNQHVHTNAERCDSSQESQDESHSPEELGCDRQESKWSWNMHHAREKTHRTCEPEASEPAQQLLRAVREKDNSQHQSQNRRRGAVIRGV